MIHSFIHLLVHSPYVRIKVYYDVWKFHLLLTGIVKAYSFHVLVHVHVGFFHATHRAD